MRPRILVAAGLALCAAFAHPAASDDYRHGRVRLVEPGVTLQRATESDSEEALVNAPFLPGDRAWTDATGRVDFQFPDGSAVRTDSRSKLDYAGHDEADGTLVSLRLWSGSLILRVRSRGARFEVETPAGTVSSSGRSLVRVDVDQGEARLSVYEGEAAFDDGRESTRLASGERVFAGWGGGAREPERFDPRDEADDEFARWEAEREAEERWASRSERYLPDELDTYGPEFDSYGEWRQHTTDGYVWVPRVAVDWRPYSNGHWAWTPYGWTWVPNDPWGWAPFHYGRWGHSAHVGWYWIPGRAWAPAWVSWASGGGYVGWCPLGRHDRPIVEWGHARRLDRHPRGRAVPRARGTLADAWNVVPGTDLGRRDLGRRRIASERIERARLHMATSPDQRPTRDGRELRTGTAVPRSVTTRPRPGDFVRELAVDNRTTIPAPWFRSGQARRRGPADARGVEVQASRQRRESTHSRAPWHAPAGETSSAGQVERTQPAPPPSSPDASRSRAERARGAAGERNRETRPAGHEERAPQPWFGPAPARHREDSAGDRRPEVRSEAGAGRPSHARPRHEDASDRAGGASREPGGGASHQSPPPPEVRHRRSDESRSNDSPRPERRHATSTADGRSTSERRHASPRRDRD